MANKKSIPTFIINLKSRSDRKEHILNEFAGREEFAIQIIEPVVHQYPVISLWNTIKHVVRNANDNQEDYILICEDDHIFGTEYTADGLRDAIAEADELRADILSGGVSSLKGGLQVSEKLFWMEEFSGTQFIVIYKRFFQKIIDAYFDVTDTADYKIAALTDDKYFVFPFFSTQKSFGYSDVTPRNNTQVKVENLFRDTIINIQILKDTAAFYELRRKETQLAHPIELPENVSIPTYVINLPERTDRKKHIVNQFKGKPEFDVTIVEACRHPIGAVGLWLSFRKIIQTAIDNDDDVIIICEDDHCFTPEYSRDYLLSNILEAHCQDAEYLSGGTSYFNFAIPVSENRFWVDTCLATQFIILYKKTFESILREPFDDSVIADILLSRITANKMILSPGVSRQQNFGYSDVSFMHNDNTNLVDEMFSRCNTKISLLKKVMAKNRLREKEKISVLNDNLTNIMKSFFLVLVSGLLNISILHAQSTSHTTDSLTSKIISYGKRNPMSSLFTCFDKTVYENNESIWFTAYLLNYNKKPNEPNILSAILVNDQTGKIGLEQKFEITDGLSFGHAVIPDSIPPGDYSFITYTNILINGIPKDVFIQPITIKSAAEASFDASLKLIDSAKADNNAHIVLSVETKDHLPLKAVAAAWGIGRVKVNMASGMVKTDADGKYFFSIPRSQILPGKNFLNVRVNYKNEIRDVKMLIPVDDKKLFIGFYPEGGDLVDGLVSTVGCEVKTVYGRPLSINALLYQDNHVIDTIHTDSYGMSRFRFMPQLGSKYELRLIGQPGSNYALPRILPDGVVITAQKAIAEDSLQLKLTSKLPGKFMVMIHNFKQVFYSFPIKVTAEGKKMLINLANLPKGLSTITILDSLQRPCAERIFFAHYNRHNQLSITTDRADYGTRQKVRLKLRLSVPASDSSRGIVTVACVQSNKIEVKKANDIESYVYLKQELEALPVRDIYMGQTAADKEYLEKVLLIKGWRKYQWQDLALGNVKEDKIDEKRILLGGEVTRYGKPLKKPVELVAVTDSATKIITTDANGDFQLNANSAATAERKKLYLILSGVSDDTYEIKMKNSFNMVNHSLAADFKAVNYYLTPVPVVSSDSSVVNGLNHEIKLKEVKITGQTGDAYNLRLIRLGQKNECGDYVCRFNVLNCPNHLDEMANKAPVVGKSYTDESGTNIVYHGCTVIPNGPSTLALNGVNYPREFYGSDYSVFNSAEPEYQSTIFWKHACFISSKETVLEFYTSDVTGPFSIIVQGISSNDVIYAKKELLVNRK